MISECANCAAPLDVDATSRIVRCAYCGHKNTVPQMRVVHQQRPLGWQPVQQWVPPSHARAPSMQLAFNPKRHARTVLIATLLPIVLTAIVPLAVMFGPRLEQMLMPWKGDKQFICSGNDKLEIDGVKVKAKSSPAILVEVNCTLHITDSKITANNLIEVRGNGKVIIEGSTLTSTGVRGLDVDDNGALTLVGSKLRVRPKGSKAKVVGIVGGGNFFVKLQKSSIELRASRAGGAVTVAEIGGNKALHLRDSTVTIQGKPAPGTLALTELAGNAQADIRGGKIEAHGHPLIVRASREVRISGTQLNGKLQPTPGTKLTVD